MEVRAPLMCGVREGERERGGWVSGELRCWVLWGDIHASGRMFVINPRTTNLQCMCACVCACVRVRVRDGLGGAALEFKQKQKER